MDEYIRADLIKILRRVRNHGTCMTYETWGPTWLPRWKRWINRIVAYLGIPFHDYGNYKSVKVRRLSELEDERICDLLFQLSPRPQCQRCGSFNVEADPAGYYCDAEDHLGAPLMCLDHEGKPPGWKFSNSSS